MNKFRQQRAVILGDKGFPVRRQSKGLIDQRDYIAVPPPANLPAQPVGDCLIWKAALGANGYGRANFPDGETGAHRQAFRQSRSKPAKTSVLHLCHRRFCVQPSHLYEGDAQANVDDRRLYVDDDLDLALAWAKSEIVQSAARFRWPSPPKDQHTLVPHASVSVNHECEYTIPAGNRRICPICEQPEELRLRKQGPRRDLQPAPDSDKTTHEIVRFNRTFSDFSDGMTLRMDSQNTFDIARTRSERRRMEKARKKTRNKPVLISKAQLDLSNGASQTISSSMGPLYGPALLVTTISRSPRNPRSILDDVSLGTLGMARQLPE